MIRKTLLILLIALTTNILSFSQSVINSPYTRFGIGEIDRNGFNHSKAMGGLATGLRKSNQINYMNPAAISSQDTMSFIFDIGINGIFNNLETSSDELSFKNMAFDHLAISFPIQRWWFASFGVTPYSKIGYNVQQSEPHSYNDTINMYYDYLGNGGINQLFLTNSFKLFKGFSFGFNFNYLFGSLEQYNQAYLDIKDSYSTVIYDKYTLNKVTFDFGLQYFTDFRDKYFLVAGITYSNKVNFKAKKNSAVLMTDNYNLSGINVIDYLALGYSIDSISASVDNNYKIEVPARYSFGFTTGIIDKLTVGFDYSFQDWSDINSLNIDDNFTTDQTFNFGIEYIPNKFALRNYLNIINYRAGFVYNKSYLKFNNEQINNYGITFGLGFPVANRKTTLNLSCTIGKKGTTENGLIQENYTAFGINLTLYDFWFFKRQIQ